MHNYCWSRGNMDVIRGDVAAVAAVAVAVDVVRDS